MKTVLFICIGNAGRSQMAEGFFNSMGKNTGWRATSAGTSPASRVGPISTELMAEAGIDISRQTPKRVTEEMVENADMVVTMGCLKHATCPDFLRKEGDNLIDWEIEDPYGRSYEEIEEIRELIRENVRELIDSGRLDIQE